MVKFIVSLGILIFLSGCKNRPTAYRGEDPRTDLTVEEQWPHLKWKSPTMRLLRRQALRELFVASPGAEILDFDAAAYGPSNVSFDIFCVSAEGKKMKYEFQYTALSGVWTNTWKSAQIIEGLKPGAEF